MADPQRFRRGKTYLVDHAVTRLELSEGVLLATVVGGRPEPYHVTITVETVPRPDDLGQVPERAHVARLIPRGEELLCTCTCPDWDDPCKHGVAALLALAAELGARPELLVAWRCERRRPPPTDEGRLSGPSRPSPATRARRRLRNRRSRRRNGTSSSVTRLAIPTLRPCPREPLTLPAMHLDRTDVSEMIRSAWQLARYGADGDSAV